MLNHYTTKMTGSLETWIIHLSFLRFYTVIQGVYSFLYCQNPYSHMKCLYQNPIKYCNMAIYCNTLKHNTQYGIDPYCFTPTTHISTPGCEELILRNNKGDIKYQQITCRENPIIHRKEELRKSSQLMCLYKIIKYTVLSQAMLATDYYLKQKF